MSNAELSQLKAHVRKAAPTTTMEVFVAVEQFFDGTEWSLLKDEYQNRMTEPQREALYQKLLTDR